MTICGNPIQNLSTEIPNPVPTLRNSISPILRSAPVATNAMCRVGKASQIISICGNAIQGTRSAIQNLRQRFRSRDTDSGFFASDSKTYAADSPVENSDSDVSASESNSPDGDSRNRDRDSSGAPSIPDAGFAIQTRQGAAEAAGRRLRANASGVCDLAIFARPCWRRQVTGEDYDGQGDQ